MWEQEWGGSHYSGVTVTECSKKDVSFLSTGNYYSDPRLFGFHEPKCSMGRLYIYLHEWLQFKPISIKWTVRHLSNQSHIFNHVIVVSLKFPIRRLVRISTTFSGPPHATRGRVQRKHLKRTQQTEIVVIRHQRIFFSHSIHGIST